MAEQPDGRARGRRCLREEGGPAGPLSAQADVAWSPLRIAPLRLPGDRAGSGGASARSGSGSHCTTKGPPAQKMPGQGTGHKGNGPYIGGDRTGAGAWAPYGRHAPAWRAHGHPDETTRAMAGVAMNGAMTHPGRWVRYPSRNRVPSACGTAGAVSWCLRQPFAAPARADLCRGCRCRWRMAVCSACARAGPVPFLPGKAAPGALSGMVRGCCRGRP